MIRQLFRVLDETNQALLRRLLVYLIAGAVLQGIAFVLVVPILRALLSERPEEVVPWLALLAVVAALYAVVHWVSMRVGYHVGAGLSRTFHRALGDHVAALPLGWFTGRRTGELGQLVGRSVVDVMGTFAHLLRPVINAIVSPAVVVVAMFFFDWRLALASLVTLPLAALMFRFNARRVGEADHVLDEAAAETGGRVVEFAQSQPVLRAFRRTIDGNRMLDDALVAQSEATRALLRRAVPSFAAFIVTLQFAFTIILFVGVLLALGASVDAPELIALLVLAVRFVEPLIGAADLAGALQMARNALDRIEGVLQTPTLPEPLPAEAAETFSWPGAVEFQNVSFSYDGHNPVLENVSLTVPPRTMTALIGPSGSGKTTITRLIARFFDVDSGTVRVGGEDVRSLTTEKLMAQVSLVFQDVYLFEGTVLDNIRVGRSGATDAEVLEAARAARVDQLVERLPRGWDTPVGEGGASLSGGERQRVAIARAILKDAPIVLLDEATASLDPENEAAVQAGLRALTATRTLVVIAHRLETVMAADQIALLDHGRIVEVGTHAELLDLGGRYAAFWSRRSKAKGWRMSVRTDEAAEATP